MDGVSRTVVETLMLVASWGPQPPSEVYAVADAIERGDTATVCPLCEQRLCEARCPLRAVRPSEVERGVSTAMGDSLAG